MFLAVEKHPRAWAELVLDIGHGLVVIRERDLTLRRMPGGISHRHRDVSGFAGLIHRFDRMDGAVAQ
jgi:hypothetical protein